MTVVRREAPLERVLALARRVPLAGWVAYWRMWQRYHRYTVDGLHHLDGDRSMLIVGYHARPLAFDMCMLTVALYDRLGYMPHGVVHRGLEMSPLFTWSNNAIGFVTGDGEGMRTAIARGEHIVVTPGGGGEGCRSFLQRYRVNWGNRIGYLRLARKYRLPIVPVAAAGADDTYIGLVDAEALGRLLGVPRQWAWALWTGVGPLGLYPFSPPFPVRLRQIVGQPIDPWMDGARAHDDGDASLLELHAVVVQAVQDLLDQARGIRPWESGRPKATRAGR
jgi:1-acyl-sn-glycerol-3-phosphate acyltransferase